MTAAPSCKILKYSFANDFNFLLLTVFMIDEAQRTRRGIRKAAYWTGEPCVLKL